jgi:formylglycine-generating enzyme required for sulfatase activity
VGQKQVNAWFLSDMAGNVWEWCNDWLEGHLGSSGATNPVGASSGTFRVARGGSWNGYAETLRAAFRNVDYPTGEHLTIGLRVARTQ